MAKETRSCLNCWIEVAPALLIRRFKISISPSLETITEEETEEYDEELEIGEFTLLAQDSLQNCISFIDERDRL